MYNIVNVMKVEQSLKVEWKRLFQEFFLALQLDVWFPKIIVAVKNLL